MLKFLNRTNPAYPSWLVVFAFLVNGKKINAIIDLKAKPPYNTYPIKGKLLAIAETQMMNVACLYETENGEQKVHVHSSGDLNSTFTCLRTEEGYKLCYGRSDFGGPIASIPNDPFIS